MAAIKTCWILTEGIAGTENQCLGVAEALGVTPVVKRIKLKFPWKQLSPWFPFGHQYALAADSDQIAPPWPDLVIASGRKSIGMALHIKKMSSGKTFIVQIQDPRVHQNKFDMIAVPQHDPTRGDNVLVTTASLHRVTRQKLDEARTKWETKFAHLPRPLVAVMIGGSSKAHRMTPAVTNQLVKQLLQIKGGLMVTASRRTGEENAKILKNALNAPHIWFWDGTGDNPYFGFLALADYIIVTEDSVSMTSEAISTGKPVYIARLEGGGKRLDAFHKGLQDQGYTRPFTGALEKWTYTPPQDTMKVSEEIKKRIKI